MPYLYPLQRLTVLLLLSLCFVALPCRSAVVSSPVRAMPSLAGAISIKWAAVEGASHYVIEQSGTPDGTFTKLATVNAPLTTYRHTGLGYDQKLYYRIQYYNGDAVLGTSGVMSATTHPEGYIYKIMPLGDSNTFGTKIGDDNDDGSPVTPYTERVAYRGELYKSLKTTTTAFDFIGSQHSGSTYVADDDNAGFSGARDEDIASLLEYGYYTSSGGKLTKGSDGPYLDTYQPDIILLHVGTNWVDGSAASMGDVTRILNQVDAYEERTGKEVTVILAKILQRVCYVENGTNYCPTPAETEDTFKYNQSLQTLAENRVAAGDRLDLVDMETGAGIIYKYAEHGGEMADYMHPTAAGYKKMANVWFSALQELLAAEAAPPAAPIITRVAPSLSEALSINWEGMAEAGAEYIIESAASASGQFQEIGKVPSSQKTFRHTGLLPGQTLYYRIRSLNGSTYSGYSAVASGTTHTGEYKYKIMPMGDSNTYGEIANDTRPESEKIAYRKDLHKMLTDAGISFDFVGSQFAGQNAFTDPENAGFPGIRDEDLADILKNGYFTDYNQVKHTYTNGPYLDQFNPDIILLHIGTNWIDGSPEAVNDVVRILDEIDAYETRSGREVTVVLAKILQRVENSAGDDEKAYTTAYNNNVRAMATERVASTGDRILFADMEERAGLVFNYDSNGGEMVDNLHPSEAGFVKVAKEWFNVLSEELRLAPLPVELVSFKAQVAPNHVLLKWQTASEKDNSHFIVERMQEGGKFREIGSVQGAGNSQVLQNYKYTDSSAPTGTLYYRLKQVDLDGNYEYSNVVALTRSSAAAVKMVYPNPSSGKAVSLRVSGFAPDQAVTVRVVDVMGKEVSRLSLTSDPTGTVDSSITFPVLLPDGLYIVQVITPYKTEKLKLLVEQRGQ